MPRPEAIKQKSGKYLTTKETWPKDDASRIFPAVTFSPGKNKKVRLGVEPKAFAFQADLKEGAAIHNC